MFTKYIVRGGRKYAYLVESYREGKKVKQRTIKYLGKVVLEEGREKIVEPKKRLLGEVKVKYARRYGELAVLHHLASELNLKELINKQVVKNGIDPGDLCTIIAINKVVEPVSGNKLGAWYADTALQSIVGLEESKVSSENIGKMFDAMLTQSNAGGIEDKIFQFEIELWNKLKTMFNFSKNGVVYDVTSTYVYGKTIPLAAKGYNRDGNYLSQYNIGLAVTQPLGIPLHFKVYPGNIVDVSTVKSLANELKAFDITDVTYIIDRGFFSAANLVELKSDHSHVIGAIPATLKIYSTLLAKSKGIEHVKNARNRGDELLYMVEHLDAIDSVPLKFLVVLNPKRREEERTRKMKEILEIEATLNRIKVEWESGNFKGDIKETIINLTKGYKKCFTIVIKKYDFRIKRHDKAIQRILNRCGLYVLFTTQIDLEPLVVIDKYFEKDVIEKSFFIMKQLEELQPTRWRLENRVYANVFTTYLGLLLYSLLKAKLPKVLTPQSALEELQKNQRNRIHKRIQPEQTTELTNN